MITFTQLKPNVFHLHYPAEKGEITTLYQVTLSAGGSLSEKKEQYGISHLVEHTIASYYNGMDATALGKYYTENAMYQNASTSHSYLKVISQGHISDSEKLLDMALSKSLSAELREETFEQQKKIVLSEIAKYYGDPERILQSYENKKRFNKNSYVHNEIGGTKETVSALTFQDIQERYSDMLSRSEVLLVSAGGKLSQEDIAQRLLDKIKKFDSQKDIVPLFFDEKAGLKKFKILPVVHEHGHEDVLLKFYLPFPSRFEDYGVSLLYREIFFSGRSSFMYDTLRNKLGIIYSLSSNVWVDDNLIIVSLTLKKDFLQQAIDAFIDIICNTVVAKIHEHFEIVKKAIVKREDLSNDKLFSGLNFTEYMLVAYNKFVLPHEWLMILEKVSEKDILEYHDEVRKNLDQLQLSLTTKDSEVEKMNLIVPA